MKYQKSMLPRLGSVALVAVLGGTLYASPSSAEPITGDIPASTEAASSGPSAEVMANQERMRKIADALTGDDYEIMAGRPGLGGIKVDPDTKTISLAWKGKVPAAVKQIIKDAPADISINVTNAKFTRVKLWAAAQKVLTQTPKKLAKTGTKVTEARLDPSGQGLMIGTSSVENPAMSTAEAKSRIATDADVDVTFTNEAPKYTEAETRWTNAPAWSGGGAITRRYVKDGQNWTSSCTIGFGAYPDGNPSANGVITADHCGDFAQATFKNGNESRTVGTTKIHSPAWDSVYIPTSGASGKAIFSGGPNSSSFRGVSASAANYVGEYVCSSGATSGQHCDLKITDDAYYYRGMPYIRVETQTYNGDWAAHGDSGGPVWSTIAGSNNVVAKGIISTVDESSHHDDCAAYKLPGVSTTTQCYSRGLFSPIRPTLSAMKLTIRKV